MASHVNLLDPPPKVPDKTQLEYHTKVPLDCPDAPQDSSVVVDRGEPCGGGGWDAPPTNEELIALLYRLSPEHQRSVLDMVQGLAKIEGIEAPTTTRDEDEPLETYVPAWENSLHSRGFSPGTINLYFYYLHHFFSKVAYPITTLTIEGYIASRQRKKLSPHTVKSSVKAIKSFFLFLYDRGITPSDLTAKIRNPKVHKIEKKCPTEEEVAKFLPVLAAASNPRAKTMLFLFMNTGIRFTEMATLPWGKVYLKSRQITVLGKGSKWRTVPISPWLSDFLAALRKDHTDEELVFPTESKTGKWDNTSANRMIARLCLKAGIRRYSCHQFRHYFATHLLRLGGDKVLKAVQELLGHEYATTTLDYYYHVSGEEEIIKTHESFAPLAEGNGLITKEEGGHDGKTT